MKKQPLVSVVITVYNAEKYIKESIISVLNQSYKNIELIIVNDGSTDKTYKIIRKFNDSRINIINLDLNIGQTKATNIGVDNAKGEFIALSDADDINHKDRIEKQLEFLVQNPEYISVTGYIKVINDNKLISSKAARNVEDWFNIKNTDFLSIRQNMFNSTTIAGPLLFFRKKTFYDLNRYNEDYKVSADCDFKFKLMEAGKIYKIPEILYYYRLNPNSITYKKSGAQEFAYNKSKFDHLLRQYLYNRKFKKIIVWGAGQGAEYYFKMCTLRNIKINKIIDNDPNKIGILKNNIKITKADNHHFDKNNFYIVTIGIVEVQKTIKLQLDKYGIKEWENLIFFNRKLET